MLASVRAMVADRVVKSGSPANPAATTRRWSNVNTAWRPYPEPPSLGVNVFDLRERGADTHEGIDHHPDERLVAQPRRRGGADAVEQAACLSGFERRKPY